ncbi:hypothetical protein CSOJ01_03586 [Colletotrichum sojae]|uniref:Uncharacterized protein n=1 Tax=Colletotrichum sojae TaxID=2175907 RepID=A0A8H6JM24_9PEZI|nr:hypothetical protein CSOJ01_03586 [Colletotrichum sojae]
MQMESHASISMGNSLVSDLIDNGGGSGQPDAAGSEVDCAAKQQPRSVGGKGRVLDQTNARPLAEAPPVLEVSSQIWSQPGQPTHHNYGPSVQQQKCGELESRAALPSAGCTPLDLRKPSTEYRQWSPSESSSAAYPTADGRPSPDSCPPPCGITNAKLPPRGGVRPLGDEGEARTARRNPSNLRLRFAGTISVSLRLRCEPQRRVFWSLGLRSSITMARVLLVNLRSTSDLRPRLDVNLSYFHGIISPGRGKL